MTRERIKLDIPEPILKRGFELHRFDSHFSLGMSGSVNDFFNDRTNSHRTKWLWLALMIGPYQISFRWPVRSYGIRVIK